MPDLSDRRTIPGPFVEADEGRYFVATNPTPGTAIAQTIQTSFLATNALCTIFNGNAAGGARIYLDYIRLIVGTAAASATSCELAAVLDKINRFSSGGSAITPVCSNLDASNNNTGAVINFGAVTAAAASAARIVSRITVKPSIQLTKDSYVIKFGAPAGQGSTVPSAVGIIGQDAPPIVIAPQGSLVLHVWNPANSATAPTYEFELGYFER
jgi:hypothetical protein